MPPQTHPAFWKFSPLTQKTQRYTSVWAANPRHGGGGPLSAQTLRGPNSGSGWCIRLEGGNKVTGASLRHSGPTTRLKAVQQP